MPGAFSLAGPALRMALTEPRTVPQDIEKAIEEAQEVCEGGENQAECATAWDQVGDLGNADVLARVHRASMRRCLEASIAAIFAS